MSESIEQKQWKEIARQVRNGVMKRIEDIPVMTLEQLELFVATLEIDCSMYDEAASAMMRKLESPFQQD